MQAIATLVQNDPYLKLSKSDRIAGRKERRAKLTHAEPLPVNKPVTRPFNPSTAAAANTIVEYVPASVDEWTERQKQIHPPMKTPWFKIVDDLGPVEPTRPTVEQIQYTVARYYGVRREEMLSPRRLKRLVRPRQVAIYLCKELTFRSNPDIGRRFGQRDSSTVFYSHEKAQRLRLADQQMAADIETLKGLLGGAA